MDGDQLESLVWGAEGLSTTEVAARVGADRQRVLAVIRGLVAVGRVRRSGTRRAARWHGVTDEDRIAQRAAELSERVKRRPGSRHTRVTEGRDVRIA